MARAGSILVIDDEEIMREILEALLAREGYEVRLAADGAAGLELARAMPFDAAVVDVMMPGMDGLEVLDELKKVDDDLAVVMVTAYASVDTAVDAMKRARSTTSPSRSRTTRCCSSCATPSSAAAWSPRTGRCARTCRSVTTASTTSSARARRCAGCST